MKNMNKTLLYTILATLFVGCLLISNILSFKIVTVDGINLPAGVIIFPIVYIVNDVLAEIYGFKSACRVILLGFAINSLAVIAYNIAIAWPSPVWFEGAAAFETVLSNTFRILIASFTAYLIGTSLNSYVMVKMRDNKAPGSKGLFIRAITSTLVGESVDAMIFITIAFFGTMSTSALLMMILTQAMIKTTYEIIVFPLTKLTINIIRVLPEGSAY